MKTKDKESKKLNDLKTTNITINEMKNINGGFGGIRFQLDLSDAALCESEGDVI